MAFINFDIRLEGNSVADHVISYQRSQQLCTGIGTMDVTLENKNLGENISPWDTITLYEEGHKIGTYLVNTITRSADGGTSSLQCQDYSKKLVDNFISDNYSFDYLTTNRYWIEFLLNDSDVNFTITADGDGGTVAANSVFGMSSAYDLIITFLQQSGWYIYFDKDGDAIIGNIEKAGDTYDDSINDSEIISINRIRNDNRLRNRAVVWGMGDPLTGTWISADVSRHTQWNYDRNDKRPVVLSNSMIYSIEVAQDLATKMLNEFADITNEITIELIGHHDIDIGDMVYVDSKYFSGKKMVTTIQSEGSANGMILRIVLNQKCPRLFAYFGYLSDYIPVYIGTWGQGVWRKYTGGYTWENVSSGLVGDALYILDLFIKGGVMACVANDGYMYYSNITTNTWTKFVHGDLWATSPYLMSEWPYAEEGIKAVSCSIDSMGNIIVGYNYTAGGVVRKSWVLTVTGTGEFLRAEQIVPSSGQEDVVLIDLEAVGFPEDGIIESVQSMPLGGESLLGYRSNMPYNAIDGNCYTIGPAGGVWAQSQLNLRGNHSSHILESDDTCWTLEGFGLDYPIFLLKHDLTTMTTTHRYPMQGIEYNSGEDPSFVFCKHGDTFEVVSARTGTPYEREILHIGVVIQHYRYTIGDDRITKVNEETLGVPAGMGEPNLGPGVLGSIFMIDNHAVIYHVEGAYERNFIELYAYDTISKVGVSDTYILSLPATGWEKKFCNRYVTMNSDGVYANLLYWSYKKAAHDDSETKETSLYNAQVRYTKTGGIAGTSGIKVFSHISSEDIARINGFLGASYGYTMAVGANNNDHAYVFHEFNVKDIWVAPNNYPFPPLAWETRLQTSYVNVYDAVTGSLVNSDVIEYPGEDEYGVLGKYADSSLLHTMDNTAYYNNGNFGCKMIGVYSVTNTPIFAKYLLYGGLPAPGLTDNKIVLIPAPSLQSSIIDMNEYITDDDSFTLIYSSVDDYDGSIYIYMGELLSLLGFDYAGNLNKTISNYGLGVYASAHNIQKNYDFTSGYIRSFEPRALVAPRILKHTSVPYIPGTILASQNSIEQTTGVFEMLLSPPEMTKVEISKGSPTVLYTPPTMSGIINPLVPLNYTAASLMNTPGSFYAIAPAAIPYFDARVFDVPSSGFTISSGELPTTNLIERYIGYATSGAVLMVNYLFTGNWLQVISLSGLMTLASGYAVESGVLNHLETTNYTAIPYLFVSVSGPSPLFFQRTMYPPYWVNASYTLPSGDITVIRIDDDI